MPKQNAKTIQKQLKVNFSAYRNRIRSNGVKTSKPLKKFNKNSRNKPNKRFQ